MIAYYFPPVGGLGAAGSQRMCRLARYLPLHGWDTSVLTVRETSYEPYLTLDPSLLARLSPDTKVRRTRVIRGLTPLLKLKGRIAGTLRARTRRRPARPPEALTANGKTDPGAASQGRFQALKDAVTDLFEIPDEEAGWLLPAVVAGVSVVRREKIDVLCSSGRPWTAHLIGCALKRLTGRPLITDFRDPWMTNPFRPRYSAVRDKAERWLEGVVIRTADLIVANTSHLREEFSIRFPAARRKCVEIGNGFDPEDYRALNDRTSAREADGRFRLVHSGFLYGERDPRTFLDALTILKEVHRLDHRQLEVELVGPVGLPYDLGRHVKEHHLDQIVHVRAAVPYQESLEHVAHSDAAILLQPGTMTQVPSKLYEYVGLGKVIFAIAEKDSAVCWLMERHNLGSIADARSPEDIAGKLHAMYGRWKASGEHLVASEAGRDEFDVRRLAGILAEHMRRLGCGRQR
jgi:glycosyltransferase involved in cell wall biosynthesis